MPPALGSTVPLKFSRWECTPSLWFFAANVILGILLLPVGVGIIILAVTFYRRASRLYIIEPNKVVVQFGLLVTSTRELRIGDIRSVNVFRRGIGGFFGFGTVEFSSAAHSGADIIFGGIRRAGYVADIVRALQDGREPSIYDAAPSESSSGASASTLLAAAGIVIVACIIMGVAFGNAALRTPLKRKIPSSTPLLSPPQDAINSTPIPRSSPTVHFPLASPLVLPSATPTTVVISQRAAIHKYPSLGVAGSDFNEKFLDRYHQWQITGDKRLQRPNWPELLADECAAAP